MFALNTEYITGYGLHGESSHTLQTHAPSPRQRRVGLSWNQAHGGKLQVKGELFEKRLARFTDISWKGLTARDVFDREVLALSRLTRVPEIAGLCPRQLPQLMHAEQATMTFSVF